jgi:hypothetical protein
MDRCDHRLFEMRCSACACALLDRVVIEVINVALCPLP